MDITPQISQIRRLINDTESAPMQDALRNIAKALDELQRTLNEIQQQPQVPKQ